MSNTETEHDLTTDDGFAAYMREKESGEEGGSQQEGVAPPAESSESEGEGEVTLESLQAELDEARKQDEANQQMIGRQAQELGELRANQPVEEEPPAEVSYMNDALQNDLGELFDAQGGAGMMLELANKHPEMIDAGISFWKAQGDPNAYLYETRMLDQMDALQQSQEDPRLQEVLSRTARQDAEKSILQEYGREKLERIQPHLEPALELATPTLKKAIADDFQSGEVERIVGAFKTLAALAEPLAAAAPPSEGGTRSAAKQAAVAATGSSAPSGARQSGDGELPNTREGLEELPPDERRRAAAQIMAKRIIAQQTSVAEGLTKG